MTPDTAERILRERFPGLTNTNEIVASALFESGLGDTEARDFCEEISFDTMKRISHLSVKGCSVAKGEVLRMLT